MVPTYAHLTLRLPTVLDLGSYRMLGVVCLWNQRPDEKTHEQMTRLLFDLLLVNFEDLIKCGGCGKNMRELRAFI